MSYEVNETFIPGPVQMETKPSEMALASLSYIHTDIRNIKNNYISLGFHLNECFRCGYYRTFGYDNFNDFVFDNFGLNKSSLSRCLAVFERFAARDGFVRKMWIDDRYKDYSYSQLCEMVSMDTVQVKRVKPDMTIREIREFKKSLKEKKIDFYTLDTVIGCDVATEKDNADVDRNLLDYAKFTSLHGAALHSYLKNLDAKYSPSLYVCDKEGYYLKELSECWVDVLDDSDNGLVLRIDVSASFLDKIFK